MKSNKKILSLTESARMRGVDYFLDNPNQSVKESFPELFDEDGNIRFALFTLIFGKAFEKKAYLY